METHNFSLGIHPRRRIRRVDAAEPCISPLVDDASTRRCFELLHALCTGTCICCPHFPCSCLSAVSIVRRPAALLWSASRSRLVGPVVPGRTDWIGRRRARAHAPHAPGGRASVRRTPSRCPRHASLQPGDETTPPSTRPPPAALGRSRRNPLV